MALKECLIFCLFSVLILISLSLSAPAGNMTNLRFEKVQILLPVDTTASGSYKPDYTKWIFIVLFCIVVLILLLTIYCCCSGKWKKGQSGERQSILSHDASQAEYEQMKEESEQIKKERDFFEVRGYREDVVLDPMTAHPRLEVSENGDSVKDSGKVLKVPDSEGRFDSHMFVLGKEGFSTGRYYWEVKVGQKKSWDLGVASKSVSRKGKITLAPHNGYWVIGLDGRSNYWARTDPWTQLKVSGKATKIGLFLNTLDGKLCFYDANKASKLHTFTVGHGTFYPFFSMGSVTKDSQQLKILKKPEEEVTVVNE